MVLVSVKMRNQISISAIQFMNSVLRSKLTSAKRSESTVFELVFPDIENTGLQSHDKKELQRLYVASALLVAPAVHAATGEDVGAGASDEEVAAWPRATRGYEADVGLFHIPGERDLYLDGVLSLANPRTYPGCEDKAGKVAELWARRKNLEHPVLDRNTGRRLHSFDFRALASERHGFIAKESVALIRKFASRKAAHFELDPSAEISKWYAASSFAFDVFDVWKTTYS